MHEGTFLSPFDTDHGDPCNAPPKVLHCDIEKRLFRSSVFSPLETPRKERRLSMRLRLADEDRDHPLGPRLLLRRAAIAHRRHREPRNHRIVRVGRVRTSSRVARAEAPLPWAAVLFGEWSWRLQSTVNAPNCSRRKPSATDQSLYSLRLLRYARNFSPSPSRRRAYSTVASRKPSLSPAS